MNSFLYYAPTKVCFGENSIKTLGENLKELNVNKVLIHYGSERIKKNGLYDNVVNILNEYNIKFCELGGVVPNPELTKVYEGIELCKKENVDLILAIGGGSVIDSSKAIGYGLSNDGDVWDFYEHTRVAINGFPIGVILTIAAAGSEMSNSSVITNDLQNKKRGYGSNLCRAKFAIMDPVYTVSLGDYQTMAGCADIMMHTMERYFTNSGNMELTDSIAEGLLNTVKNNTIILHSNPNDINARGEVMWASSLSHNGLTGCGNGGDDFVTHSLEHELSGMFGVTHGAGLCALWSSWARYVYKNCLPRFVKFARNVMGVDEILSDEEVALKGIEKMEEFYALIGMPTSIKELGLDLADETLKELAHKCSDAVGGKRGAAMILHEDDFYEIYKLANNK